MNYSVLFYESKADLAQPDSRESGELRGQWMSFLQALTGAGVMRGGAGLQPPSMATTVRLTGGQRQVQDGPFADTREQLGGFVLLETPNLDAALEWAARAPCASTGCVEVRPMLPEDK